MQFLVLIFLLILALPAMRWRPHRISRLLWQPS